MRFKLGVEAALHDKKMVRAPNILSMIVSQPLRAHFEQEIYKLLAESAWTGKCGRWTKKQKTFQRLLSESATKNSLNLTIFTYLFIIL